MACTNCHGDGMESHAAAGCGCGGPRPVHVAGQSDAVEIIAQTKCEWKATVDALPHFLCLLDDEHRVVRANLPVGPWMHLSVRGLIGKTVHDALHPACTDPACELASVDVPTWEHPRATHSVERFFYDRVFNRYIALQLRPVGQREDGHCRGAGKTVMWLQDITDIVHAAPGIRERGERMEWKAGMPERAGDAIAPPADFEEALRRNASELHFMAELLLRVLEMARKATPEIGEKAVVAEMCEMIGLSLSAVGHSLETCLTPRDGDVRAGGAGISAVVPPTTPKLIFSPGEAVGRGMGNMRLPAMQITARPVKG
jgi:hypothetical protein